MLVSQYPNLGNPGSWEQTLQKGSPVLFLWVAPLRWATQIMNSHHLPWLPAPCDSWSSSELLGSSLPLSQAHPTILLTLHEQIRIGGDGRAARTWVGAETGEWGHRPSFLGALSKMNTVFLRRCSSICIQNFRNKQKWKLFLSNFLEQNR